MTSEKVEKLTADLVKASFAVLQQFKSGKHPSEGQLEKLERALFPFVNDKICGHRIIEDCYCEYIPNTWRNR